MVSPTSRRRGFVGETWFPPRPCRAGQASALLLVPGARGEWEPGASPLSVRVLGHSCELDALRRSLPVLVHDRHGDGVAGLVRGDRVAELIDRRHRLAVDRDDHVAAELVALARD